MEGDIPVFTTGDVNAFEYGGGILYYQPEYDEMVWHWWDEPLGDGEIEDAVYWVRMFRYPVDGDLLKDEFSWVNEEDMYSLCRSMDCSVEQLYAWSTGNIIEKWMLADTIAGYYGPDNLDHYADERNYKQMVKAFDKDLDKAAKNNADKAIEIVEKARSKRGKQRKDNPVSRVFQISQEDVDASSTLEDEDVGKWTFISNGAYVVFADTYAEAAELRDSLKKDTKTKKIKSTSKLKTKLLR